jgi:hypothetical protein
LREDRNALSDPILALGRDSSKVESIRNCGSDPDSVQQHIAHRLKVLQTLVDAQKSALKKLTHCLREAEVQKANLVTFNETFFKLFHNSRVLHNQNSSGDIKWSFVKEMKDCIIYRLINVIDVIDVIDLMNVLKKNFRPKILMKYEDERCYHHYFIDDIDLIDLTLLTLET